MGKLSDALETSTDRAQRKAMFRRMLEICEREDPAYTVLHQTANFTAKRKDIQWKAAQSFVDGFPRAQLGRHPLVNAQADKGGASRSSRSATSRSPSTASRCCTASTLEVGRGEAVGLVGESGCGKSVTWLAALGLLPKKARVTGSVTLDGSELLGGGARDARRACAAAGSP